MTTFDRALCERLIAEFASPFMPHRPGRDEEVLAALRGALEELDAMRPVVVAAEAYRDELDREDPDADSDAADAALDRVTEDMIAAVDTYRSRKP